MKFDKAKIADPKNVALAKELHDKGYRVTSRKHRIVSRLDRPDWLEFMQKHHCECGDAEWYLRCLSKDSVKVLSPYVFANLKTSCVGSKVIPYVDLNP